MDPSQMTEEELNKTSHEQQAELPAQQCIFCHIISGKIPSRKIYEDDTCLAILDINPANPGHTLIMPKKHHPIMPMMPEEEISRLFKIAKKVSAAIIRGLKTDGTNIFIANGAAAGQKAPHFMIHVIPRTEGDGVTCFNLPKNKIGEEDQQKLKKAIRDKIENHLGQGTPAQETSEPSSEEKTTEEPAQEAEAEETREEESADESPQESEEDEESDLVDIPPPEHFEKKPTDEEEETPKKGVDLDRISKLFG